MAYISTRAFFVQWPFQSSSSSSKYIYTENIFILFFILFFYMSRNQMLWFTRLNWIFKYVSRHYYARVLLIYCSQSVHSFICFYIIFFFTVIIFIYFFLFDGELKCSFAILLRVFWTQDVHECFLYAGPKERNVRPVVTLLLLDISHIHNLCALLQCRCWDAPFQFEFLFVWKVTVEKYIYYIFLEKYIERKRERERVVKNGIL